MYWLEGWFHTAKWFAQVSLPYQTYGRGVGSMESAIETYGSIGNKVQMYTKHTPGMGLGKRKLQRSSVGSR